jgi:hypothetical protein
MSSLQNPWKVIIPGGSFAEALAGDESVAFVLQRTFSSSFDNEDCKKRE